MRRTIPYAYGSNQILSEIALVISYCLVLLEFTVVRTIYISHASHCNASLLTVAVAKNLNKRLLWDDILMSLYKAYLSVHPSIYWILPPANRLGI
jgi:hypothetical protein